MQSIRKPRQLQAVRVREPFSGRDIDAIDDALSLGHLLIHGAALVAVVGMVSGIVYGLAVVGPKVLALIGIQ